MFSNAFFNGIISKKMQDNYILVQFKEINNDEANLRFIARCKMIVKYIP